MLYTASTAEHLRRFHAPYLAALVRDGHRVVAAGAGDGRGLPAGVEFRSLPFQKHLLSPENLRCLDTLVRWMERGRFDGVVANTALASFYTRLAAAVTRSGAWVVNISHGYLFAEPPGSLYDALLLGAERFLASVTDALLVMNETDRTIAARHRLCRGAVRRIDGMGVPMAVIAPSLPKERAALRAALGIPEGVFAALYAAEFSPRKNQAEALRALALLPEDVWLLLPGDGAERARCRDLAAALGLSGRVRFPGDTDVTPYRIAADVCLSSSRSEGLPFHVMEAMAAALPCVLSAVKGHTELVAEGETGLLYPPGDEKALAAALRRLHGDPVLCGKMGLESARRAQRYALERVFPQVYPLLLPPENRPPRA